MRCSHYNILSNETKDGEYVLLNSLSGLMDVIDKEAYDVFSSYAEADSLPPEVIESLSEIKDQFLERGYLTDLSYEEEKTRAKEMAFKLEEELSQKQGVVLVPNLGCNYRCTYCFEQAGGYPSLTMSKEQVDAILSIMKDHLTPGTEIILYGGEPLEKKNREIIEYIINKGTALNCSFVVVTNGHDLECYKDLIGGNRITALQITVDGPKEIHDSRRISLDGNSSFDRVLSNIEWILRETDAEIRLRINVDKQNASHIHELLDEMDRRKILNNPALLIAASPVVGAGDITLRHDGINKLVESIEIRYPQFKEKFMLRTICDNQIILPALYFGLPVKRKIYSCAAASTTRVFTPDGNIYSCWQCIGSAKEIIGTYDLNGHVNWNFDTLNSWRKTMIAYRDECMSCKYAFLCAGGCCRPALPTEKSAHEYDCEYYNYMFVDYLTRVTNTFLESINE